MRFEARFAVWPETGEEPARGRGSVQRGDVDGVEPASRVGTDSAADCFSNRDRMLEVGGISVLI